MKTFVTFVVRSAQMAELDLVNSIGGEFTRTWSQGEPRGTSPIVESDNGVELSDVVEACDDPAIAVSDMLDRISPYVPNVVALGRDVIVELKCAVYSASPPPLFFDKKIIARIAAVGASFDIDLYWLNDDSEA